MTPQHRPGLGAEVSDTWNHSVTLRKSNEGPEEGQTDPSTVGTTKYDDKVSLEPAAADAVRLMPVSVCSLGTETAAAAAGTTRGSS